MTTFMRSTLFAVAALAAAVVAAPAAFASEAVLNRDFAMLRPSQPSDTPGKIEVIEFFSWGCPHCATLHPKLTQWLPSLPKDAVFKRVPVGFGRPSWQALARAYYALEATGDLARLDAPMYQAIHERNLPLADEASIASWVAKQGVDRAAFVSAYNSFGVGNKVARAEELTRRYRVSAVPTFTVAGRYAVIAHTEEQTLATASQLVARARKENAAALN